MNARVEDVRSGALTLRRGNYYDIGAINALGLEALKKFGDPRLRINPHKVAEMSRRVMHPGNYCHVAERDGKVVAAVSAIVEPMLFHERMCASVVQFFAPRETAAGAGILLLRDFLKWARSRHGINPRVSGHSQEFQWLRLKKLLEPAAKAG